MRNQERTALAAALALVAAWAPQIAGAEEIFRKAQGVNCRPDGTGCAQIQGYIYVHRDRAPAPLWRQAGAGDAQLGERRFYLDTGGPEPR